MKKYTTIKAQLDIEVRSSGVMPKEVVDVYLKLPKGEFDLLMNFTNPDGETLEEYILKNHARKIEDDIRHQDYEDYCASKAHDMYMSQRLAA